MMKGKLVSVIFAVIMLVPLGALVYFNRQPDEAPSTTLIVDDKAVDMEAPYYIEAGRTYLKTTALDALGVPYTVEASQNALILPVTAGAVPYEDAAITRQISEAGVSVNFPLKQLNEGWYIELERLSDWLGIGAALMPDERGLLLDTKESSISGIVTPGGSPFFAEPGGKGKRHRDLVEGEKLRLFSENAQEYRLRTRDGLIGYGRKSAIISYQEENGGQAGFTRVRSTPGQYGPINITFEYVSRYSSNPDISKEEKVQGLDVLCPTWFTLDEEAVIRNDASIRYTRDAHALGYRVWGVFRNDFEPERTHLLLTSEALQERAIAEIALYAAFYELDGINIDFENVYLKDKAALVSFLKALDAALTRQGVILSVDAAPPWGSDQWSLFLDRSAVARIADYIVLMAYDEHYAGSPESGSVASLGWTERAVTETLALVPAEKLVLGVPLYTRLWTETSDSSGSVSVSSKAIGMRDQESLILGKDPVYRFDEEAGQMTATYEEDGAVKKLWLEDETSMKARLGLIKTYKLAGLASWRRGFETDTFWTWVRENLKGQ